MYNTQLYQSIPLDRSFYERNTIIVARELIGHVLVRIVNGNILAGIIVETEAYRSDDPACHAYRGKTLRNAPLFGTAGLAYVYFIYGCHFCLNIVSKEQGQIAGGVLIRAIKPLNGIECMKKNRGILAEKNLTNGPGKVTQALQITRAYNFHDCTMPGELFVTAEKSVLNVQATPRIGISSARDKLWRFIQEP